LVIATVSSFLLKGKSYGEVVPVLNSAPSHHDKWGSARKVSSILHLSTWCKWVVNFLLNSLHLWVFGLDNKEWRKFSKPRNQAPYPWSSIP